MLLLADELTNEIMFRMRARSSGPFRSTEPLESLGIQAVQLCNVERASKEIVCCFVEFRASKCRLYLRVSRLPDLL